MTLPTVPTVPTAVGAAIVLHRLALAVDCVDATTRRRPRTSVRIGREMPARVLPRGYDPAWPCFDLEPRGPGRALVRLNQRTPTRVVLRLVDPARRYVPRRFDLPLWKLPEILTADAGATPVPAASRLLRPWLLPGSGASLSRGLTTVRGSVRDDHDRPVRWARITAVDPGNQPVGWAHADERGEFLMVIEDTGTLPPPAPTELPVRLRATARNPARPLPVDPDDPYADLPIEAIGRSSAPPGPADVENDTMRGRATPVDYLASSTVQPPISALVGQEFVLTAPIAFTT